MPDSLPIIDIGAARADGNTGLVASAINEACRTVGFFQIVGHGVDIDLLDEVYRTTDELTNLPLDQKEALRSPTGHVFRGLSAYPGGNGQRIERFQVNAFDDPDDARTHGIDEPWLDYFHPNVWPAEVPDLEPAWRACFNSTRLLGATIMRLFAEALELPSRYFDPMLTLDASCFGANIYYGQTGDEDPHGVIIPAHTDSGTLTLLHQRGTYAGLQVHLLDDDWITVPVEDAAIVVNIGDLMARWTNDQWVSTPHRVIAGPRPSDHRTSITTFHLPSVDTIIEPLSSCVDDTGPHYKPITTYAWEAQYINQTYDAQRAS